MNPSDWQHYIWKGPTGPAAPSDVVGSRDVGVNGLLVPIPIQGSNQASTIRHSAECGQNDTAQRLTPDIHRYPRD
jgi:hypothetical protein